MDNDGQDTGTVPARGTGQTGPAFATGLTSPLKFIDDPKQNQCILMREVDTGVHVTVDAVNYLSDMDDWLKAHDKKFLKMAGCCFWYNELGCR